MAPMPTLRRFSRLTGSVSTQRLPVGIAAVTAGIARYATASGRQAIDAIGAPQSRECLGRRRGDVGVQESRKDVIRARGYDVHARDRNVGLANGAGEETAQRARRTEDHDMLWSRFVCPSQSG